MKKQMMLTAMIAFIALSLLAARSFAEEKKMEGMKHDPNMMKCDSNAMKMKHHMGHMQCPCMMTCSEEGKKKCKEMGMSDAMMQRCELMRNVRVAPADPEALLAMKKNLMLTDEQVNKLKAIADKSRQDAELLLTAEQKDKLKALAATPETMMKLHEEMMPMMKKMEMEEKTEMKAEKAEAATEQKICPVTGKPINKEYSTVYKGKTVYFCCAMCKPEFDKNPEKYVDKLPQFKK